MLCIAGFLSLASCDLQKTVEVKIMSYNIRHGQGMDEVLDLSRAASIIRAEAPDLCGLQEIDHYCSRTDSVDQTGYLAEETKMTGTFGKFMDYQGGQYGMATLSAKPLVSTKVLSLPDGIYEPRSAIILEAEISEDLSVLFANVHFDWINGLEGDSSRLNQAMALVEYLDTIEKSVIITGDFNCTPNSPTMQYFYDHGFAFAQKGADSLSFQGGKKAEIDHVIYRSTAGQKISLKRIKLLDEPLVSDHRPLVAELEVTY
ncbi:hypothetical protein BFP97_01155 [Roseivirga sp. 4D4]|nr:hypothetical protein BFP97_01155 [Roseivirga sp. 4D4]